MHKLVPAPFPDLLRQHELRLHADPSRVVLRPFHLSWQAKENEPSRAAKLVRDILALSEQRAARELASVLADFSERHWQTDRIFDGRFSEIAEDMSLDAEKISLAKRRLIGAYFCHEYSYAAAALMNPSIVPHPDQSGMTKGAVRFVMSMRAVGEGHISSIVFSEGIIEPGGGFELWPQQKVAMAVSLDNHVQSDIDGAVCVHRQEGSTLSNSVIFPITEQQRNGLEDLRLVAFDHDDGDREWIGTYTAYSGRSIRSELLRTRDFKNFVLEPVRGRAGRNKGMALFPQKVGDRYCMIGRQDGKNLFLLTSDDITTWDDDGVLLMEPKYPWELVQIGNCGSPILTRFGWLVLTHGVGAMRKYALGAMLLDRDDPSRVIGRTPEPILTAAENDREGYVPNVIYTCGAMACGEELFIPYGISDSAIGFASCSIDALVAHME
ncbi:MAG: glycoside hydrolase family 130 protein [Thermomicrobiales bacterium]